MKKALSILICMVLFLPFSAAVKSEAVANAPDIRILGSIGGPLNAVMPYGGIIYAGEGSSVIILDGVEGDLAQKPFRLNLQAPVSDLKIDGKTLYAAAGSSGLHIIDVTDPLKPVVRGVYQSDGTAGAVVVKDSIAYLANGTDGLEIIDVSDPSKPVALGHAFKGKCALGLALNDNKVYIAAANDGLLVADVSQKNEPKELGVIKTPGIARNVVISGPFAYVADDWQGVCVLDIAKTAVIKSLNKEGRIVDIAVDKNCLYCAEADYGLEVLDITVPSEPARIAESEEDGNMTKIAVYGGKAYCAFDKKGILCYDITDPRNLKLTASRAPLSTDGSMRAAIKDSYAYAACGGSGLQIIDMKDPGNPFLAAHQDFPGAVTSVKLNGEFAYLFSDDCIYTVAISDPTKPFLLNETLFVTNDLPQSVDMDSNYLYVSCGNRLHLFSIKDPANPVLINVFMICPPSADFKASGIAVRNGIAYISAGIRGIFLYDVSDAGCIKSIDRYANGIKNYANIDFFNNLAFAATPDENTVEVLDVSDIRKPKHVGTINTDVSRGDGYQAAVTGSYALLPDESGGVLVANVSSPAEITQTAFIGIPGIPESIEIQGDKAYVTDQSGAITILRIPMPAVQPQATPSATPSEKPSAVSPNASVSSGKVAYLTFDDGPSRSITPKNLDTLKSYGVKATFFVLPHSDLDDIYKRILDEGHAIGNHSYSHETGLYKNADSFKNDVIKARDYIFNKFNYTTTVFRYPGGTMGHDKNKLNTSVNILKELGYSYFDWNASTADTDPNIRKYGNEEFIVNLVTNNVVSNTKGKEKLVVLMHDSAGKTYTAKALPGIIEGLKKQGYSFDVLPNY